MYLLTEEDVMQIDLRSEDGAKEWVKDSLAWAAKYFNENGTFRPQAILLTTVNPDAKEKGEIGSIVIGFGGMEFGEDVRAEWTDFIRKQASEFAAIGVICVAEAWAVVTETDEGAGGKLKRPKGSLEFVKGRREVLMVVVEHVKLGCQMWMAEIKRDSGKVYVGEFDNPYDGGSVSGKFTRFLPQHNLDMS